MSDRLSSYPLHFTVGITGKRSIVPENREALVAVITAQLTQIKKALSAQKAKSPYDKDRTVRLSVVTALAAGADQIGAKAAIACKADGWALDAIVPFERSAYRARLDADLADQDGSAQFDDLLSQCDTVFEMSDFAPPDLDPNTKNISHDEFLVRRRYRTVGQIIIRQCDILIALWDGAPASGMGGTADVMTRARRLGVPIVWIDPVSLEARSIMPSDSQETNDLVLVASRLKANSPPASIAIEKSIEMVLLIPIAPPKHDKHDKHKHEKQVKDQKASFERFLGVNGVKCEVDKLTTRAFWYQALLWLILFGAKSEKPQNPENPENPEKPEKPDKSETAVKDMPLAAWSGFKLKTNNMHEYWPKPSVFNEEIDEVIKEETTRADRIATRLSHWYRSAYIGIFLGASLAVVAGMVGTFYPEQKMWFVITELVILSVALGIYFYAQNLKLHSRFMAARNFAEMMRAYRIPALLGFSGRQPLRPEASLSAKLINALAAKAGLPNLRLERKDLTEAANELKSLIESQMGYHNINAQRLSRFHHRLDKIGFSLVGFAAIVGVVFVGIGVVEFWPFSAPEIAQHAISHGPSDKAHAEHSPLYLGAKALATFLGAALPALAAGLALIRFQGDFERFAERSEITQTQLSDLEKKLKAFYAEKSPTPYEDLVDLAFDTQEILNKDLADWHFVYSARPTPTL